MQNFLDPAILFFVVGVLAGCLKSNLEIPQPISRFLSLYLLMALGLKGGFALAQSGLTAEVAISLGCAVLLAVCVPIAGYQLLRRIVPPFDAAALAATYGSVSAVTFITATQYLDGQQIAYGGHMAAAMALMESPAIIIAVLLANSLRQAAQSVMSAGGAAVLGSPIASNDSTRIGKILHESFTDGTQLLLLGAMLVGLVTGDLGKQAMAPFSVDLFKGMLAFFLLDMGLLAARNLGSLRGQSPWLLCYAVLAPLAHAMLALGLSVAFGIAAGNAALLMVLAASASYIAVPAVVRYSIPEANPSMYFSLSLGVTFPLNILIGIPVYSAIARHFLG
ncbi:sodium-dependent bicarbonate transport family permease [Noviherbaspirillum sp. CPCC 100848]|uniref:Sodium-dependent bicarbonate transport family permease n=1 Tax=Noviherbaspirillum album TaxID=3080276 RepID=A0ABU6J866_9BURK|nr:sodium-dependent bicarbonate transport family permease [Noviherbaspirillum sp. CPCC 100848]MEC4719616.1 sodium-dependent bicarbonate transport family permease [Noviherbaspirillum sp. CPCC 100848]